MLEVLVRNANGNLNDQDRDYAAKKLGRLDRYFHTASRVELAHIEEKRGHKIEVTVFADGMHLRGDETDESLKAAIDRVSDKLETRLRRLKTRLIKRHRHKGSQIPLGLQEVDDPPEEVQGEDTVPIAHERHYDLRPMSLEDASLFFEMLDHPFFVFHNIETSKVEVLYKRQDGQYGLVTPEN